MSDLAIVVIDNGTGYTKMGYAGNMEPSYLIPTVFADSLNKEKTKASTSQKFENPELDFYIGEEAFQHQKTHQLSYLIRSGQIENWEGVEKFWHKSIYSYLRCEPEEHRFILTEPPLNTPENREQMAEIMFETFNVKGLFIGVQATLALYAQICGPGRESTSIKQEELTGTVIDSGDGVTHVFPVADGYVIGSCVRHVPLAGRDITKFVLQQLRDRGEKIPNEDALEIAQKIKEKYGYVCKDIVAEYEKYDTKTFDDKGKAFQSNKFKKYTHKSILTGETHEIDVGYERFLGPEMFFHPEFIHSDWRQPLDEIVDNAIQSCPIDTRRRLYSNIVLSGGSTLFDNFDKRLTMTIQERIDDRFKQYQSIAKGQAPKPITANVYQNMVQRYAVWFGGSVLGSTDHFAKVCHSREDYMERGPSICRHNPVFPAQF